MPYAEGRYWDDLRLQGGQAVRSGLWIPSVDKDTRSRIWTEPMWQRASFWKPLPLGSKAPKDLGGALVEETIPTEVGAGILGWERIYAERPRTRVECVEYVYSYQFVAMIGSGDQRTYQLIEIPKSTRAKITYEYFTSIDGANIPLLKGYRIVLLETAVSTDIIYIGGSPDTPSQPEIIAEDSRISRWRGNIWERAIVRVPGMGLLNDLL